MVVVADAADADAVVADLGAAGERAWVVGEVVHDTAGHVHID
jgi:phosphoribosylaminoimidazole (AIR) synthetase